ncbi:MAG: class I SAM-dependent methyltransferase [Pseudomonadota bacterium]
MCPVCRAPGALPFLTVDGRDYGRCGVCEARFLDPRHHPSRAAERAVYAMHRNDPADPGYRRFAARLATPLLARVPLGSSGLDFGCGPASALAALLEEAGHRVARYDPAFFPDPAPLARRYGFVAAMEVVEHLHDPAGTFDLLAGLLEPGGVLAIMTCFQTDDARFARWHYRRDPTHVVFYRRATLAHVAAARGLAFESPVKDVAFLRRPAS